MEIFNPQWSAETICKKFENRRSGIRPISKNHLMNMKIEHIRQAETHETFIKTAEPQYSQTQTPELRCRLDHAANELKRIRDTRRYVPKDFSNFEYWLYLRGVHGPDGSDNAGHESYWEYRSVSDERSIEEHVEFLNAKESRNANIELERELQVGTVAEKNLKNTAGVRAAYNRAFGRLQGEEGQGNQWADVHKIVHSVRSSKTNNAYGTKKTILLVNISSSFDNDLLTFFHSRKQQRKLDVKMELLIMMFCCLL